jgi:hypothetical protein
VIAQEGGGSDAGDSPAIDARTRQDVRVHLFSDDDTCLRLAVAGVATRNAPPAPPTTSGTITLPPGPDAGNVVWAGLYWVILDGIPTLHGTDVTLNGAPVSAEALPTTPSPCWPEAFAYAYFADVTGLVQAGANVVGGLDDSGELGVPPESEGASLVVVYEDPTSSACEIIVTDGNDLLSLGLETIVNALPVSCGDGLPASLYFVGGDGQAGLPDFQLWNGVVLGADAWNSSDPAAPGAAEGWDSDGWTVTTGAPNLAASATPAGFWDCVSWIATAIEVNPVGCVNATEPTTWGRVKGLYR